MRPATGTPPSDSDDKAKKTKNNGGDGGGDGLNLDPLIPAASDGWPKENRLRWFRTFAMNVSQIYDTGDDVVDLTIKLGSGEQ